MEEVLRKFYNRKHTQIQRNKFQSQLQLDRQALKQRYKQSISKKYEQPYTPSTDFSLDEEYKYKKQLFLGNDFLLLNQGQNLIDLQQFKSHQNTFFLPKIQRTSNNNLYESKVVQSKESKSSQSNKKKKKNLIFIFKTKAIAILFLIKIKKNYKTNLMNNKLLMQKYASQFLQIADKTINLYYLPLLKEQIGTYFSLLSIQIKNPKVKLTGQILKLVTQITEKLSKSTIRKDLLHFLSLVSNTNSFFPSDFLTKAEICRLEFNPKFGYFQNLTEDQSRMIVSLCLGIKIFCVYLIFKPWLLKFQHSDITQDAIVKYYKRSKKLIFEIGSIFYHIIIQQYLQILKVKSKYKDSISILKQFQIDQLKPLNVYPQNFTNQSDESQKSEDQQIQLQKNQILKNQKKDFYSLLQYQYPEALNTIRINIIKWLDRISLASKNLYNTYQDKKMEKRKKEKLIYQDKFDQIIFKKKLKSMK